MTAWFSRLQMVSCLADSEAIGYGRLGASCVKLRPVLVTWQSEGYAASSACLVANSFELEMFAGFLRSAGFHAANVRYPGLVGGPCIGGRQRCSIYLNDRSFKF